MGVVGGSLTESTRDLQRPAVEIPRLVQRDLGGKEVSDEVDCPLEAQLPSYHSPVERVRYLEGQQVGCGGRDLLAMPGT